MNEDLKKLYRYALKEGRMFRLTTSLWHSEYTITVYTKDAWEKGRTDYYYDVIVLRSRNE